MICFLQQKISRQLYGSRKLRALQTVSHKKAIGTGIQQPARCLLTVGSETVNRDHNLHIFTFSGCKVTGLCKADQSAILLRHILLGTGDIDLHDLPAIDRTCICHLHDNADCRLRGIRINKTQMYHAKGKIRIGQAIAEAVAHRNLKGVKIAVSHIDSLFIKLRIRIPVHMRKGIRIRIILIVVCPAVRQLSTGCHRTAQHICQR